MTTTTMTTTTMTTTTMTTTTTAATTTTTTTINKHRWHLGHCNEAYLPTRRGFDTQFGFHNSHVTSLYHLHTTPPFAYDFFRDDRPLFGRYYGFTNQGRENTRSSSACAPAPTRQPPHAKVVILVKLR